MNETNISLIRCLPENWLKKPNDKLEISKLPTILEVKEKLTKYEETHVIDREENRIAQIEWAIQEIKKGNIEYENLLKSQLKIADTESLLVELQNIIDNAKFQNDNSEYFIATKTNNNYTLKPNITKKHFLFRGQTKFHEPCLPNVYRENDFYHLIENIKRAEFEILLESHPLFKLLFNGIHLNNDTIFRINNPYGLAQHYGLKTALLDFTSDIDVGAFFSTSIYDNKTDSYLFNIDNEGYGVLYVYHMTKPLVEVSKKITSIGLQVFNRPGCLKGFLLQSSSNINDDPEIIKIFFKHDSEISKSIYNEMNEGKLLFENDILSEKTKLILESKSFSLMVFERNFMQNPNDNPYANMSLLQQNGISISSSQSPVAFSDEDLVPYYEWIQNGGWEEFCEQIIFPNDIDNKVKNELLSIKDNPLYKEYFYK